MLVAIALAMLRASSPLEIIVRSDHVIRRDLDRFFGIDLNYIRDRDSNRPEARPLDSALEEMGARWLRYPGGEKSNFYLWSEPPYQKPSPRSLGWYATPAGDRMDFDEFATHCRAVHAEPFVVVGCASKKLTGRTTAQWLENAVSWVRYSKSKGYHVQYWEIGNENWHKGDDPGQIAKTVVEFSIAMKAADPGIEVGASGDSDRWWSAFLPIAGDDLDFLSVSDYPGWEWRSYDRFLSAPTLTETADSAIHAIQVYASPAARERLRVIAAETNTNDYSKGGWPETNDLGHALVTFATLGQLASKPRVRAAMVWTTRWMNDQEAKSSVFYALGSHNEILPTGQALRAWGAFVEPNLLETDGTDATAEAYAARTDDRRAMRVWLLNRAREPRAFNLKIEGTTYRTARIDQFSGGGSTDASPKWEKVDRLGSLLPPLSITVVSLQRQ